MPISNSIENLPLAINVIGPVAIKKNGKLLDVWLPILSKKYPHQAAVGTDVDSHELVGTSEYSISDPSPSCHPNPSSHYNPPKSQPSVPYEAAPKTYPPSSYFIHITLPRPKWIVGLSPVSCRVYDAATPPPPTFDYKPIGFRLLYETAGTPILTPSNGTDYPYALNFDPAPDEKQLEMFIAYSPYNFSDYNHPEATDDFQKLTGMFGLKLNIDFEFPFLTIKKDKKKKEGPAVQGPFEILNGPAKDCKAPSLLVK